MDNQLKEYYIERTDVSYCTIMAYSPEDAINRSGNGMLGQNWHTDVGEEVVTVLNDPCEWHCGAPPHVGWWNVSAYGLDERTNLWRWWDGEAWSVAVSSTYGAYEAGLLAKAHMGRFNITDYSIRWSDHWPANACVPRIDPGV